MGSRSADATRAVACARVGAVDDDEHFGGKIAAAAVEQHARHLNVGDLVRMLLAEKIQGREAVLAVDDEELPIGIAQVADGLRISSPESELLVGEQQNGAGDEGLADRGLVEVKDLADFATI